jgi:hypothetical protein
MVLTMSLEMSLWPDNLLSCTLETILGWQVENRAWSKDLRREASALVNRRLADEITQADYLAIRQVAREDAAECRRRAMVLEAQIARRVVAR